MSVLSQSESGARLRWLLLGSLALNLLFVGATGAVAFRYSSPVPLTTVSHIDHGLASRLDRIADSLPSGDAELLRAQLRGEAIKLASAQADLRLSQEDVRNSLRAQPFDADAMRNAMAQNRAARQNFDQVLHDTIAAAAAKMSDVGRVKLAEWPPERDNARPLR
jgi:uncharacterized membrane protein